MKPLPFLLILVTTLAACDRVKETTKNTIGKTGETVGKGTSEFFDGVTEGVDETFRSEVVLADPLPAKGLKTGKFLITSAPGAKDNIFTVYLIFEENLAEKVTVKVFDNQAREYGRVTQNVVGKRGEAKYFDFVFDKRTNVERRSRFVIEPSGHQQKTEK